MGRAVRQLQPTAVVAHEAIDDLQTESGAASASRPVRADAALEQLVRKAGAIVTHFEDQIARLRPREQLDPPWTRPDRLDRIEDEIEEGLSQAIARQAAAQLARDVGDQGDCRRGAIARQSEQLVHERSEREYRRGLRCAARGQEEV